MARRFEDMHAVDRDLVVRRELGDTGEGSVVLTVSALTGWQELQALVAKTRDPDLPVPRPQPADAYVYDMEVQLPAALQHDGALPGDTGLQLLPPKPAVAAMATGSQRAITTPGRTPDPHQPPPDAATEPARPEPKRVLVADEEAWARLQRLLPASPTELLALQLQTGLAKARSPSYVMQLQGFHAMWELAIATSGVPPPPPEKGGGGSTFASPRNAGSGQAQAALRSLAQGGHGHGAGHGGDSEAAAPTDGVWSEDDLGQLVRVLGGVMKQGHSHRVGAAATGCCSLAALWWLMRQPQARLKPTAAQAKAAALALSPEPTAGDVGGSGGEAAGLGEGGGAGAQSEVSVAAVGGGGADTARSRVSAVGAGGLARAGTAQGQPAAYRLQLRRKERASANKPTAAGPGGGNTLLAALLLSSGPCSLGPCLAGMLGDLQARVAKAGKGLLKEHRSDQMALAGVWAAGLFTEILRLPVVRNELALASQLGASAVQHQHPQLTGGAAGAGGAGAAGGAAGGGAAGAPASRRRVGLVTSPGDLADAAVGGRRGLGTGASTGALGLEVEEVYTLLLGTAALPGWLSARGAAPWDLQPMAMSQAATVIQSTLRAHIARRELQALRDQVRSVFKTMATMGRPTAAGAKPAAPAPTPAALMLRAGPSKHALAGGQQAGAAQGQGGGAGAAGGGPGRIGAMTAAQEVEMAIAMSAVSAVERYFDATNRTHPGVAAAEALAGVIASGGPLAREHLAAAAHPSAIIRLLDCCVVPARVAHLGVALLAHMLRPGASSDNFFRHALPDTSHATPNTRYYTHAPGGGGPGGHKESYGADVKSGVGLVAELLRWLAPLCALEPTERQLRFGPQEPRAYPALRLAGSTASAAKPYTPPPLVDWRWGPVGSELSTHAATATWALCAQLARLWAEDEAAKKAVKAKSTPGQAGAGGAAAGAGRGGSTGAASAWAGGGGGVGGGGGGGGSGAVLTGTAAASAAAGPQSPLEKATHRIMSMAVAGICSGRHGPATHILLCGLVTLAGEPTCLAYMIRAGLVDAGPKLPPPPAQGGVEGLGGAGGGAPDAATMLRSGASRRAALGGLSRKQSMRRATLGPALGAEASQAALEGEPSEAEGLGGPGAAKAQAAKKDAGSLPGYAGIAPHTHGLIGMLADSDVPGFMEIAVSLIGLIAARGTPYDPVKGGPPGSGIGGADQVPGSGSGFDSWGTAASPPGGGWYTSTSVGGVGPTSGPGADDLDPAAAAAVPDLTHDNIPARRLIMAGGWGTACHCLAAAGGACPAVPGMAAAAIMFMAKEVYLWSEVLTAQAARRAAAAAAAALRPPPTRRRPRVRLTTPAADSPDALASAASIPAVGSLPLPSLSLPADGAAAAAGGQAGTTSGGGAPSGATTARSTADAEDDLGLDPDLPCPKEVANMFRCLLGEDFRTLTQALQVLTQLYGRPDQRLLQCACLAAYHLAAVPVLRDVMGKAGVVGGLVAVMRRWYDLPPSEQRAFRATGEWAMAALVRLTAEPVGDRNRYRLANAFRDDAAAAAASSGGAGGSAAAAIMRGFGYAMTEVPGSVTQKRTGRTGDDLLSDMKWGGGWGWGGKAAAGGGADAAKAAAAGRAAGGDEDDDLARELAAAGSGPRSSSDPIGLLVQLTALRSKHRSSYSHIKLPALLLLRQFAGERLYRVRLVTEGAGGALAAVANDAAYDGMTRAAAAALWMEVSQTPEGRDARWWSAMAEGGSLLTPRSNASGEAPVKPPAPPAAGASPGAATGPTAAGADASLLPGGGSGEPARLRALSRMTVSMLGSTEAEQQLVGARAAAGLLCEGEGAKAIFLGAGGLAALLAVAGRPLVPAGVLAGVCTALLNLSSYVPAQVDMCQRCARLLLHVNARFTGYHGYLIAQQGLAAAARAREMAAQEAAAAGARAAAGANHHSLSAYPTRVRRRSSDSGGRYFMRSRGEGGRSRSPSPDGGSLLGGSGAVGAASLAETMPTSLEVEQLGAVEEVLYSSSGALQNLSRHPGNRDLFYRLELEVRSRGAIADLAADVAAAPPRIPGLSRHEAANALLSGALTADSAPPAPVGYRAVNARGPAGGDGADAEGADVDGGGWGTVAAAGGWEAMQLPPGPVGGGGGFVPYYMRGQVERYVGYGSYLQEMLSKPLHRPARDHGGGAWGAEGLGGDDARSQASGLTGAGNSSAVGGGARSVVFSAGTSSGGGGGGGGGTGPGGGGGGGGGGSGPEGDDLDRYRADSEDGSGGEAGAAFEAAFPRLHTLRHHMSRPLRTMWAPLLVDRHDGTSLPLFELQDPTTGAPIGGPDMWGPGGGSSSGRGPAATGDGSEAGGGGPSGGGGGGGGATSTVSTATTIARLPRPGATTRWSPSVRLLRPLNREEEGGGGEGSPGGAGGGEGGGGSLDVRVVFETHCPHTAAARVMGLKGVASASGAGAGYGGGGGVGSPRSASASASVRSTDEGAGAGAGGGGGKPGLPNIGAGGAAGPSPASPRMAANGGGGAGGGARRSPHGPSANTNTKTAGAAASGGAGGGANSARPSSSQQQQGGAGGGGGPSSARVNPRRSFLNARQQRMSGGAGGPGGEGAGAPKAMVAQVAQLMGAIDTSKADRLKLEISAFNAGQPPGDGEGGWGGPGSVGGRSFSARPRSGPGANAQRSPTVKRTGFAAGVGSASAKGRKGPSSVKSMALSTTQSHARLHASPSTYSNWAPSVLSDASANASSASEDDADRDAQGGGFGWMNAAGQRQLREFETPGVAMWAAVPGSRISEGLYPTYRLETGEPVHMYRRRKDRVDELRPAGLPATSAPDATAGSYAREEAAALDLLSRASELPLEPEAPAPLPPAPPPRPDHSALRDARDWLTLHVRLEPRRKDGGVVAEASEPEPPSPWRGLKKSVFAARPKENDSKAYVNRPGICRDIFDKDWARATAKTKFKQLLAKSCPGGSSQVDAVRAVLKERYDTLLLAFDYYSTMCGGMADPFAMHLVAWGALVRDAGVVEEGAGGRGEGEAGGSAVRASDLDRIFLLANFEEDRKSEESKANLDNALMRFEFIDALVRTAIAKFMSPAGAGGRAGAKSRPGTAKRNSAAALAAAGAAAGVGASAAEGAAAAAAAAAAADGEAGVGEAGPKAAAAAAPPLDLPGAVAKLVDECIAPNVVPGALVDPNTFRETRLYCKEVDTFLDARLPLLRAVYSHYKELARDSGDNKWLDLPEWLELLGEARLYHSYFTVREARLAFVWSRMRYYDELSGGRALLSRSRALSFIEFLEALGRVADLVSPPPLEQLERLGYRGPPGSATAAYFEAVRVDPGRLLPDRPSSDFHTPKTRPLVDKLEQILGMLTVSLKDLFGAVTDEQLLAKLKQPRPRGYKMKKGGG